MSSLDHKTLILNKSWQPVHITTVRNALVLLFKGAAKAVCHETFQVYDFEDWLRIPPNGNGFVSTSKFVVSAPHAVILNNYDKMPTIHSFSKRNVFKRDRYTCQYCGKQEHDLTLDHVTPRSKGGASEWTNIVTACVKCNRTKADRTPKEAKMKLITKPYKPDLNLTAILHKQAEHNPVWGRFI
jgi:5-methylcytosine-specific restriction endonuclease McrA